MDTINTTLIVIPGPGARNIQVDQGTTVEQLVTQENLHGRDIIIDGTGVAPANYQTTILTADSEIFATGSVKGNVDSITLIVIPGPGARTLQVDEGTTVEQLVTQENLHGRDIIIDGTGVAPANYQTTILTADSEIFATGSVKGNMQNLTLIVIPGPGARTLQVDEGTTVEQLVTQENLHGRDIIIDGTGVAPTNYQTTILTADSEIFATGSVKGNGNRPANGPSQTGRPSGGGRGNNAPRGK